MFSSKNFGKKMEKKMGPGPFSTTWLRPLALMVK